MPWLLITQPWLTSGLANPSKLTIEDSADPSLGKKGGPTSPEGLSCPENLPVHAAFYPTLWWAGKYTASVDSS